MNLNDPAELYRAVKVTPDGRRWVLGEKSYQASAYRNHATTSISIAKLGRRNDNCTYLIETLTVTASEEIK